MTAVAHNVSEKRRTNDVLISEHVSFSGLLLSDKVLAGLKNAGFIKPSPIQLKAIPLGRCGLDLIVQAKSGTGKTCVFSVIALESICTDTSSTQVLVLAPTREIAVQIWEVIRSIGSAMKGLECHTFIGGLPLQEDRMKLKKCHIAVGSPGRIKQLIETGVLRTENIRMFVLDEADKLLEEGFQDQINWIYSTLPENKQMLALSATYPEYLADHLTAYMRNPTFLRLNISDPALLGIRQYYHSVTYHPLSHVVFEEKCKILITILSSVSFQQCLIFSNIQTRASNLADTLTNKGWPTACIAGCLDQKDRNHAMAKLKTYKCRILISTDLTARGIDADKVNLVINMDMPKDHETYLHRIGRAGRFGSFGIAVSLVSDGQEKMDMNSIEKRCNTTIHPLPDPLPTDLAKVEEPMFLNDVVSSEVIDTNTRDIKSIPPTDTGPTTLTSSLMNGEHVENINKERGDDKVLYDNHSVFDGRDKLTNGVRSTDENSVFERNRELTVYDLPDNVKNGLQFTEDESTMGVKQELDINKTSYERVIDTNVDDSLSGNPRPNKTAVHPLKTQDGTTSQSTHVSPIKSSKRSQSNENEDINSVLEAGIFQYGRAESRTLHSIPKYDDLNLSNVFKNTIGFRKQENDLTHSLAKQSLSEFRANFSGYREMPPIRLPNCSHDKQHELLRKAVCQLQHLFDRNIEVKIESGHSESKTELSHAHQEFEVHQQLKDSVEKQSMRSRQNLKENEAITVTNNDNIENEIVNLNDRKHKRIVNDNHVNGNEDVTKRMEETSTETAIKGAIQKQTKPRKHYTNKFAIAYLLEPGSSVFKDDGKSLNETKHGDESSPDYKIQPSRNKSCSNEQPPTDQKYSINDGLQLSQQSVSESKELCIIPTQNGTAEEEIHNVIEKDSKLNNNMKCRSSVTHSSKLHKETLSTKTHEVAELTKAHKVTQSTKAHKVTQASKAHRADHYTSDSDSDSSMSSTDDSDEDEDSEQSNVYGPHYRQNSDPYKYQYPYHTQYGHQPIGGLFPYQHTPQHLGYHPFMYGYRYPVSHNPWLGYSSLYRNMLQYRESETSAQQVQSNMKNSFNMQSEYIKAMSKTMLDCQKGSKKKPKTRK